MFCEKCGAQIREGLRFCESCGAPVRGQSAQPPTLTPRPAQAPVPTLPKPNRKPLTVVACIAALFLLVLIFGGGSPEKAAKKFMNAAAAGNVKTAYKYAAPDLDDIYKALAKQMGMSEKDFSSNVNQIYDSMKKELQKSLKEEYGSNYRVTAKVISSEKLSNKERDDFLKDCKDYINGIGISDPDSILKLSKIKQVYVVEVEYSIKGKNGSDIGWQTLYVAKVGGKWKVITIGRVFWP